MELTKSQSLDTSRDHSMSRGAPLIELLPIEGEKLSSPNSSLKRGGENTSPTESRSRINFDEDKDTDFDDDDEFDDIDGEQSKSNSILLETANYKKALEAMLGGKETNTDFGASRKTRILKNKEKKLLAADLGIDLTLESARYSQFLDLAVNVVLPIGWKLEVTPKGKIYYYNEVEGKYSNSHPCLPYFKGLMENKYRRMLKKYGEKVAKGNTKRHTEESSRCLKSN